ncbi:glycine cleavage system H protein, mitochondrial [Plutella xylostella]|nr:glycine cleavage system H protein, mitochondrial [Plutella xylostella]XP_011554502.1 glycine cleavage system H protein, mitochondrial [Plutella xylostella]
MALQRYFIHASKQYMSRCCVLQTNLKQSYCELRHKYSTKPVARQYTDRHEWVVIDNGVGTVGISKYAQEALGDVVFAQLPEPGAQFKAGDECGALESVKAASEVYSPVSGTVTEKNKNVEDKPGLINSSCYDEGWLFKISLSDNEEIKNLMSEEQYNKYLETDVEKDH